MQHSEALSARETPTENFPPHPSRFTYGNSHDSDDADVVRRIRRGIIDREFTVAFQPIVHAGSRKLSAVECLIRWQHPECGLLLPGCFAQALENVDIAQRIFYFVVEEAFRQLAALPRKTDIPRVAVNLQPFQLLDEQLPKRLDEIARRHDIDLSVLELEVVETSDASQILSLPSVTEPLRQRGMHLAIDDFGSGYSSLLTLVSAQVETIKLSGELMRVFPESGRACTILEAMLALLGKLQTRIVVEGVETEEQFGLVSKHPHVHVQGYFLSRPRQTLAEILDDR
ncbi:EAL domain-containing protein [Paraburkholderia flava]|uniref:EAL domain-containing protein n=1 Tax=Paraburkholderia flava TaxID=2547393 RepID=UPI00105FECC3|nr:EAL domain-containing protein [Paraburkholderia flava]